MVNRMAPAGACSEPQAATLSDRPNAFRRTPAGAPGTMDTARTALLHEPWASLASSERLAPFSPTSDDELLKAVRDGDDRVAALLYEKLFPTVDRSLCRLFGGRDADHDDLVQSAFLQIVSSIASRKFHGDCPVSAWAAAVATRVGLMALRSRCRERRVVHRSTPIDDASALAPRYEIDRQLVARDEVRRLQQALASINELRAETLFLHDVAGYPIEEIATITGASASAVQSRLVRGRRDLLRRLRELEERDIGGGR
jgi:RNA polymerase sigma factor (sigma-70 family)